MIIATRSYRNDRMRLAAGMGIAMTCAVGAVDPTQAQVLYTVEDLGALGGPVNEAYDVSPDNIAVGRVLDASLAAKAVQFHGSGAVTNLNGMNAQAGEARGIASNGLVAGSIGNFATIWQSGIPTPLPFLANHIASRGWDVNASGMVIGWSINSVGDPTAAYWVNGAITPLDVNHSWAFAVNDAGQIIGRRDVATGREARLWQNGVGLTLPDLGGDFASATGVSPRGIITGGACQPVTQTECALHSVVWLGAAHNIQILTFFAGALEQTAWNANDRGATVGDAAFGFSGEGQIGIIWRLPDQPPVNLNLLIDSSSGWIVTSAKSINHQGTIAGSGRHPGLPGLRAVLLRPVNVADITSDGVADIDDLLGVISAWGDCAIALPCPADITGDGQVSIDDLLAVISLWN